MKTVILVNTLTLVEQIIYSNHIHFFCQTVKDFPKDQFVVFTPIRSSIDRARNEAAKMALMLEADYLMFIDDDVLLPINYCNHIFKELVDANKDIIAGSVRIRGYPFNRMAFKYKEDESTDKKQVLDFYNDKHDPEHPVVDVDALGFSTCLIKVDVLKPMDPPFFITSPNGTEDVYFCIRAQKELNPKPSIALHTGIMCSHLLDKEAIDDNTVERWKTFVEADNIKDPIKMTEGRNENYIEANLKHLEQTQEVKEEIKEEVQEPA
jgi:hypothetical protein